MKFKATEVNRLYLTGLFFIGMTALQLTAQVVDLGGLFEVRAGRTFKVLLMPGYDVYGAHTYYYLPANLRLSRRIDETLEFSFMTFRDDANQEVSGAILNFLVIWGLTPDQEREVETDLKSAVDSSAILGGVVSLDIPHDIPSVRIAGQGELADILKTKWSAQPVAPVFPGTKMAFSYRLNDKEAHLFEDALYHPEKLDSISIQLVYQFNGGYKSWWYNRFKENYYTYQVSLRDVLQPAIIEVKTKRE